jgi:hypothetical protein
MDAVDPLHLHLSGGEVAQAIRVRYRQSCLESGIELPGYADFFPNPVSNVAHDDPEASSLRRSFPGTNPQSVRIEPAKGES